MPTTRQWEIQNSMLRRQHTVFSRFLRAQNMVRVIEGKIIWKWSEGKQKLLQVSGSFELSRVRVIGSQLYLLIFHANVLFQTVNRLLLRNSWNHYVLSDRPCTFPLTIKNHSKNKPSIEKYQQGLLLQITTKLLQITSALLIKNCGRYYQEPCHYVSWYYKLRQNYYKLRPYSHCITIYDRTEGNISEGIVYFLQGPNLLDKIKYKI